MVYSLFVTITGEVHHHFTLRHARQVEVSKLMEAMLTSEDVLFQWSLITVENNDDIIFSVLQRIVKLYATVRGFTFASSCVEPYKQAHKETLKQPFIVKLVVMISCCILLQICLYKHINCIMTCTCVRIKVQKICCFWAFSVVAHAPTQLYKGQQGQIKM